MPKSPQQIELIARGILVEQEHVLLCRDLKHGYYSLPGGHIDVGESAHDAVRREFLEETGLVVTTRNCVLVHEHRFTQRGTPRHELNVVFLVERGGGGRSPVESREPRLAFDWVPLGSLGGIDLRPKLAGDVLPTLVETPSAVWRSTVSA